MTFAGLIGCAAGNKLSLLLAGAVVRRKPGAEHPSKDESDT